MFDRAKSEAIRRGVNMALNGKYGDVQALSLDTKKQSVDMKILLNGEDAAVDFRVGNYEIDDEDPQHPVVVLRKLEVSRMWMQELASENLEGKRLDIPAKFTKMVKMVL